MKIQIRKLSAILCAAVMLLVSVPPVPVQAETVGSLEKTLDMTLVKLGIVCDENGLTSIANTLYDTAVGNVQEFDEYCVTNGLSPVDSSSYEAWKETREYQNRLLDMVMETKYRKAAEDGTEVTLDFTKDDMNDAVHGGDGVERGKEYTIDEETVDQMHNAFQTWWSENSDYYIVRTQEFSTLDNPLLWKYADAYNEYVTFYKEKIGDGVYYMRPDGTSATSNFFALQRLVSIGDAILYVSSKSVYANFVSMSVSFCDSKWNTCNRPYVQTLYYSGGITDETLWYKNFDDSIMTKTVGALPYALKVPMQTDSDLGYLYSKVACNVKIFKTLDAYKLYSCGKQSVYFTTTYDNSVINTVTYSGDYYCDNSSTYTYSTVQSDVNNITGDVTDSIVDSTVDQSVTTIINNYYVSSGDGSGDGSGDDDGEGGIFERLIDALGDALGKILGLFEELLDLFLSAIVDAIGIIAQGLTGAVEKLRGLSVQVEGLTGFLKEFFSFVPVDYWDMVSSLMLISFVVLVVKLLKK